MRNERNSLRQAAITAGILAALGVCTLGGDQPMVWAAEPSNNTAQAEAKTAAAQDVQPAAVEADGEGMDFTLEGVTVEAKRPDWEAKLSPGTVTVIRPDDYKGEQKDLPDLLKMVPGVHVREVNGKGQYTTVSVRGSTAAQVGVFVDGVLFNLGGDAAADISTIPVQNVERIEVYRGYIPARFGGTYMGGVINIVTKRPTKANVQASFGKSSFGGYKGSLQIDAPLGSGALMVGINRDQSDGDFKYKNYASEVQNTEFQKELKSTMAGLENFDRTAINQAYKEKFITTEDKTKYLENLNEWGQFVEGGGLHTVLSQYYTNELKDEFNNNKLTEQEFWDLMDGNDPTNSLQNKFEKWQYIIVNYIPSFDMDAFFDELGNGNNDNIGAITDPNTFFDIGEAGSTKADEWITDKASHDSASYQSALKMKEYYEKRLKLLGDDWRYRKYNDYKNTDFIAKWQDEHWLAKATWKQIDRHLPRGMLWNNSPYPYVDTDVIDFAMAQTKQKLTSKEVLVGRRDTVGNLEWGWSLNYLDQEKRYKCENWELLDAALPTVPYSSVPFRKWSAYDSKRWGGAIDGTYKAGKNHLLEFMLNYSDEDMDVAGSGVTDGSLSSQAVQNGYRTDYSQKQLNIQLQDTITLNSKGDLWLTPSVRYNQSEIYGGKSVGYDQNVGKPTQWRHEAAEQQDNKVTWQLALKKQVNDNLTLRATGGTYYRLLNLYEIAGDGGGILPAPISDGKKVSGYMFPYPEEGRQYDISAIWDGKLLGADNKTQLTYFYRKSDNLLMLWRWGYDYWTYANAGKGTSRGVELQTDFNWEKWDFTLGATYLKSKLSHLDTSPQGSTSGFGTYAVSPTYTPEWEGFARVAYRPDKKTMLFGEVKYVDEMYTTYNEGSPTIQDALTTINLGAKYKFSKNFELAVGCNDIFNKGPELKETTYFPDTSSGTSVANRITNASYPIQGRTYYATVLYKF